MNFIVIALKKVNIKTNMVFNYKNAYILLDYIIYLFLEFL